VVLCASKGLREAQKSGGFVGSFNKAAANDRLARPEKTAGRGFKSRQGLH